MCEHASVNIFFKHIVPCMCMYMYCTVTRILTCVSICYHVAKCVNVLTCMYACMSMYIMTVCVIIKELVTKVKVSRSPVYVHMCVNTMLNLISTISLRNRDTCTCCNCSGHMFTKHKLATTVYVFTCQHFRK